ncbi:Holliday junction resolvase RuvX [Candidatus Shapirobacteria bacterium]|nr:Holliday junction resolvase RuvX [Candidatus Shapirobacteria bacterium]
MRVLGIDPGKKNIGLAIGEKGIIETLPVLTGSLKKAYPALEKIAEGENIKKVIVGISEGKSAEFSRKFANRLKNILQLPVVLINETLTTFEAKKLRPKRKVVDSVAAALLLKKYWQKGRRVVNV